MVPKSDHLANPRFDKKPSAQAGAHGTCGHGQVQRCARRAGGVPRERGQLLRKYYPGLFAPLRAQRDVELQRGEPPVIQQPCAARAGADGR